MSKYIDAELLRKEIEKNKNMINGLFTEGDDSVYDGEDDAYNRVLRIIDSLQQEQLSLPDNLDEAELKYVESLDNPPANQEEERTIYQTFKAGAEWMAKQMNNE